LTFWFFFNFNNNVYLYQNTCKHKTRSHIRKYVALIALIKIQFFLYAFEVQILIEFVNIFKPDIEVKILNHQLLYLRFEN